MKKKLGILSIGIGNINSVVNSFEQLNIKIIKINNPRLLEKLIVWLFLELDLLVVI